MAIVRSCVGWELGPFNAVASGSTGEWGNVTAYSTVDADASAARSGAYGLRVHPTAASAKQSREFSLTGIMVGRFYFKYPTLPSADSHIFYIGQGGGGETSGFQLRFINSDDTIRAVELNGSGTVIETSTGPSLVAGQWYRIDFKFEGTDANQTFDWRIDGVAQAQLTGNYSINSVFFGSNTSQTFDLYVDDLVVAWNNTTPDAAAVRAEYPFGAGYVKKLAPTAITSPDSSKFSASSGSIADAWGLLDDIPMLGAGSVQQNTIGTTDYLEVGFANLAVGETPTTVTFPFEIRTTGGAAGLADMRVVKSGSELTPTLWTTGWANGPAITIDRDAAIIPQTTRWTGTEVDGAVVRFGFSNDVTPAPVLGGVALMVDISGSPPDPPSPVVGDAPAVILAGRVGAFIDGRPVELLDWQCSVDADWGERTLTGQVLREVTWAQQGSSIEIWRADGTVLWSGELTQDPRIEGELLGLRGNGYAEHLAANRTRMFYRADGGEGAGWVDKDADPHSFASSEDYDLFSNPASLKWRWGNNADVFSIGEEAGFVVWKEGAKITRYSVLTETNALITNSDLLTRSFTGPDGARTLIATHSLNIGSPTTRASDITTPEDGLMFVVEATANHTPPSRRALKLSSIKIYGRTTDDEFSASEVVADVGLTSGFDVTNVKGNPLKVLPLDWPEDHPSLLDYMAELTDWRWMMRGDGLHFGPFDRIWDVSTAYGANTELEPERRYNRVIAPFRAVSGALRETPPAEPAVDPYPGKEFTWYTEELEHRQSVADLANFLATQTVAHLAEARVSGSITIAAARLEGIQHDPIEVEAGDLVNVTELSPKVPPQRIRSITYAKGRSPVLSLGEATVNTAHLLKEFQREQRKRRKRRRGTGGPIR